MTKEDITNIHIEHRSVPKYWNITMYVTPKCSDSRKVPDYAELVEEAEHILRLAKGLGKEWVPSNAEVMAWSSEEKRGISYPYRFRVTLDLVMENKDSKTDEDM